MQKLGVSTWLLPSCLVCFYVLSGSPSFASPLFYSTSAFQLSSNAFTLALGDLNRDGRADVVVVNPGPGTVSVLLSAGEGTLRGAVSYPTGSGPSKVSIVDVNRDGNLDIVTGNSTTISVLLGHGDGTFDTHVDYPATGQGLAVGDLNRDGKPDIATTTSVLLGNGDGTFQPKVDYAAGNSDVLVSLGDLNGDGKEDLVTLGLTFGVFLGNGDGTFRPRADHPRGVPPAAFRRPGLALSPRVGTSAAYFGNENWMALADVSGDGIPDLAIVNSMGGQYVSTVAVYLGRGDGTFQPRADYKVQDYPSYVSIGDLNGDGRPDIVTANDYSSTVSVLLGRGDGTFAPHIDYPSRGNAFSVAIGDANGNGIPDLVVGNGMSGTSSVMLGIGDGTFQAPRAYETGREPWEVVIGDLDADGKLDVVTANWDMNTVSVLYGNGDGTLQQRVEYAAGYNPSYADVGDINGDGRTDLVIANDSGGTTLFLSNGDRTFRVLNGPTLGNNFPVRIADVNGDGKADLVSMGVLALGNGDGTFGSPIPFDPGTGRRFAIGDINGDGKLDIVEANQESTVSVLLGNGDGTFQPRASYPTGPGHYSVTIGDVNGDGKPDVVTCMDPSAVPPPDAFLSVLLGRGDGTLGDHVEYGIDSGSRDVKIVDLDGDGRPDLVTNTLSVLLGNGDGTFRAATNYGTGGWKLAIGDLDQDGAVDVLTVLKSQYTATVHLNLSRHALPLTARVTFEPSTIDLNSSGWLRAAIEPIGFAVTDITLSSVRLFGSVPASLKLARVGDRDRNGAPDVVIQFSREAMRPFLKIGTNVVPVTGSLLSGGSFHGVAQLLVVVASPTSSPSRVSPNPLNPSGSLSFSTARAGTVRIRVFDRGGRYVRTILDDAMAAGEHAVAINARNDRGKSLASGVYFYRVETADGVATGRFVVLK